MAVLNLAMTLIALGLDEPGVRARLGLMWGLVAWIAYLSVEATERTERSPVSFRVVPLTVDGLVGIGMERRW